MRDRYGAALTDNANCYCLEAPAGMTWDGDLHEMCSPYVDNLGMTQRDSAIRDLRERAASSELEACTKPDCEWCTEA
jgi:hypothetical protein